MRKKRAKKYKHKYKQKLSNLLLRNYLVLYILIPLVALVFIAIGVSILDKTNLMSEGPQFPTGESIMKDDYEDINGSQVVNLGGWLEVIDKHYNVVFKVGNVTDKKTQYTKEEYTKLLLGKEAIDKKYWFTFTYNANKDFMLVIARPSGNFEQPTTRKHKVSTNTILILLGMVYLFFMIAGTFFYAKITSKTFVTPLKILLEGVQRITSGDYSARIYLRTRNEFGELKDAFNLMAARIERERKLKEKSEESRRRLILDVSHDLKNPLAAVIGYSDYLVKNPDLDQEEKTKYLKVIENNSIRANNLIKNLFELSKYESSDYRMKMKRQDICEFLREIIACYIPQLDTKGMEYDFDIPDEAIMVNFDRENLDRAISNLITNSINYNSKGVKLSISLSKADGRVKLVVEDDGVGIPKELAKDIFDPFVRVDISRNSKSGGTGLGLAITRSIIVKHGGKIRLDSDVNEGCRFTILLKG